MKIALPFQLAKEKAPNDGGFNGPDEIAGIDRKTWDKEVEGSVMIRTSILCKEYGETESGWDIPFKCFIEGVE